MSARLVYLRLELKRACKKLPHIFAGAIVLLLLAGTIALLSARMLYGETSAGRITVGVVLPEGDAVAKKALAMVSSLESVKSICDFEYMNKEECLDKLNAGKLYAVMEVPEGFVQDIMNGTNTPVKILLPRGTGLESRIFKELTDAGASTLGAGQAGIYAGDELLYLYDMTDSVSGLEADLNRIYMGYSLHSGVSLSCLRLRVHEGSVGPYRSGKRDADCGKDVGAGDAVSGGGPVYSPGSVLCGTDRIKPAWTGCPGDGLPGGGVHGGIYLSGGRKPYGRRHAAVSGGDCHALSVGRISSPGVPARHLPGSGAVSAQLYADGGNEAGGHVVL